MAKGQNIVLQSISAESEIDWLDKFQIEFESDSPPAYETLSVARARCILTHTLRRMSYMLFVGYVN